MKKVSERGTRKMPAKTNNTSKELNKYIKKIIMIIKKTKKTLCNLFRDSSYPNPALCSNQSAESP